MSTIARSAEAVQIDSLIPEVRAHHQACAAAGMTLVQEAMKAGSKLIEIKGLCRHGEFETCVQTKCGFSLRKAQQYMRLATELPPVLSQMGQGEGALEMTLRGALRLIDEAKSLPNCGEERSTMRLSTLSGESRRVTNAGSTGGLQIARGEHFACFPMPELTREKRLFCRGTNDTYAWIEPLVCSESEQDRYYVAMVLNARRPDSIVIEPTRGGYRKEHVQEVLETMGFMTVSEWLEEPFDSTDPNNWGAYCLHHWRAKRLGGEHLSDQDRAEVQKLLDRHRAMNAALGQGKDHSMR